MKQRKWLAITLISVGVLGAWFGPLAYRLAVPFVPALAFAHTKAHATPAYSSGNSSDTVNPDIGYYFEDANFPRRNEFVYPRLGITSPLIDEPQIDPMNMADWHIMSRDLRKGVAAAYTEQNYSDADAVFVSGHSSDVWPHPYANIFASLYMAQPGDSFFVTHNEKTYEYKVEQVGVVNPDDVETFDSFRTRDDGIKRAVLVTCWPLYTARERLVVVGNQVPQ